ncbi:NLI interacting factor-like phosphatase-domain-containing protein [Chiua virens]|nr:NLI interacting factor-like phosphatase-domain-containing protein [Chiua virens]
MSRSRRHWEEEATSSYSRSDRRYSRPYSHDHSQRHYAPPTEFVPRRSFNYWQDQPVVPTSYHPNPRRPYGRESYDERRRGGGHESSYSRWRNDYGAGGRERYNPESWRDRNSSQRNHSHIRHSTNTPPPYIPRPTFRPNLTESIPMPQKPFTPNPPRKASPPPDKSSSSEPLKPSPGYVAVSQQPSEVLNDPERIRKLLVLDLNGTLLIRSARSRSSTGGPQLRPVQPRPYMQSFRQYLFCPQTTAWLDTMVWSSAQPHSVDDMVDKVFGTSRKELKAVWNRKSLGLSEAEYHRKTITSKDLTKPWDMLAAQLQINYSAFTTLLLDDSPHKAVLQPYNHVCIPEYDSTRRQHDLRLLLSAKDSEGKKSKKEKRRDETAAYITDETVPDISLSNALSELDKPYDATLLAVVGILEAIKFQSNVAGWICKDGLWAMLERQVDVGGVDIGGRSVVQTGNDASSTSDPGVTVEQAHLQKMWFDDASVVAHWVTRGRRVLAELGIQVVHGVTG